jgi:P27 family predicted phage terminase small subunit
MNEQLPENHPAYRLEQLPKPPDSLSQGARQQWKDFVPTIFELGTARPADLPAIVMLCEIQADIALMEETLRAEGYTTEAGSGGRKSHPIVKGLEAARRQSQQLMDQFGLLPGSMAHQAPKINEYRWRRHYD